jgi:hypothetical protein
MGTCNCKGNEEQKNEIEFYKMKDLCKKNKNNKKFLFIFFDFIF